MPATVKISDVCFVVGSESDLSDEDSGSQTETYSESSGSGNRLSQEDLSSDEDSDTPDAEHPDKDFASADQKKAKGFVNGELPQQNLASLQDLSNKMFQVSCGKKIRLFASNMIVTNRRLIACVMFMIYYRSRLPCVAKSLSLPRFFKILLLREARRPAQRKWSATTQETVFRSKLSRTGPRKRKMLQSWVSCHLPPACVRYQPLMQARRHCSDEFKRVFKATRWSKQGISG